jgi:predicted RNA binding protein YcfA (HicA-like mRNA interferase family)
MMKVKRVIKILEDHGFRCIRVNGSHSTMSKDLVSVTVPVHKKKPDLKIGTLKSIENGSGIKLR